MNRLHFGRWYALALAIALFQGACGGSTGDTLGSTASDGSADAEAVAFGTSDLWGGDGLATMSPPAVVAEIRGVEVLQQEGVIALLEASVVEVVYIDSTRPEVVAPQSTVRVWVNLNTTWGREVNVEDVVKSLPGGALALLGYQGDTGIYEDLRSDSPYSVMALINLAEPVRFVGPGTEAYSADLSILADGSMLDTPALIAELASQLRLQEDQRSLTTDRMSLSLIDLLVEPSLSPAEEFEALAPTERDVNDAPEEVRQKLTEIEVFIEVYGGAGDDIVAIGIQSDAGWSGGSISSIEGTSWPVFLDPRSSVRVLLYDFGEGKRDPVVIDEILVDEWVDAAGIYVRVPASAIDAYRDGGPVRAAGVEATLVPGAELRSLRDHVSQLGSDDGVEVDTEPLPSELIGSESVSDD